MCTLPMTFTCRHRRACRLANRETCDAHRASERQRGINDSDDDRPFQDDRFAFTKRITENVDRLLRLASRRTWPAGLSAQTGSDRPTGPDAHGSCQTCRSPARFHLKTRKPKERASRRCRRQASASWLAKAEEADCQQAGCPTLGATLVPQATPYSISCVTRQPG
jgi:hypothetical protein